jgi:hypothetical protein
MPTPRPYIGGDGNLYQRSLTDASTGTITNPDVAFFALESSADLGAKNDSAATADTGTFSLIALVKRSLQSLTSLINIFTRPTIIYSTGTVATSGDNTIIPAPGSGLSIYITHLVIQNESATTTTIILKDSSNRLRILQDQRDSLDLIFPERREMKLSINTALILNLSGANACNYSIGYYTGS